MLVTICYKTNCSICYNATVMFKAAGRRGGEGEGREKASKGGKGWWALESPLDMYVNAADEIRTKSPLERIARNGKRRD